MKFDCNPAIARAPRLLLGALALAMVVLTGCSAFVDLDQPAAYPELKVSLEPGHPVGQTFVAQHGGLLGVDVSAMAADISDGVIVFHLRDDPHSDVDLRTVTLSTSQVSTTGRTRFGFQPLADSLGTYYYGFWELTDADDPRGLGIAAGPADAYLNGAAYIDHRPLEAQLSFGLVYDKPLVALDLMRAGMQWAGWLGVCLLLFVLPGYVVLRVTRGTAGISLGAALGLSAGIGLALSPLFLIWTEAIHLHLGRLYAWLPAAVGLAGAILAARKAGLQSLSASVRRWAHSRVLIPDLALLVVLVLLFAGRLLVIRTLDAPSWGDSVQHATIVQLLLDNGGVFSSWEPYTPFQSFTVHPGFHSIVATFAWLLGMPAVQATLVMGQLLNGLAILSLYPLAQRLSNGSRWAGVGAVLVGGLLVPMPAYYVNWGRYAQLAGQAILPVALWFLMDAVESRSAMFKSALLAGLTLAGATLAYYRMPFFYAAYAVIWLLLLLLSRHPAWWDWKHLALCLALVALLSAVILAPWAMRVLGGSKLVGKVGSGLTKAFSAERVWADYAVWKDIRNYVPSGILFLCLASAVWGLLRKQYLAVLPVLWFALLASLVAGKLVNLPGANMIQNFAIIIGAYIPASLMAGDLVARIARFAEVHQPRLTRFGLMLVLSVGGCAGLLKQVSIVDSSFIMVARPDIIASRWIEANVPQDSVFLVEGFTINSGTSIVGSDAGWWLPLLADRRNTMPPQYALLNERANEDGYRDDVVELARLLESTSIASDEAAHRLCEMGVTHIYVGQQQGLVGAGVRQLYKAEDLEESPSYSEIYRRDRVRVFELDGSWCSN